MNGTYKVALLILMCSASFIAGTKYYDSIQSSPAVNDNSAFKVGDCIRLNVEENESWEVDEPYIARILEVGKKKYRVQLVSPPSIAGYETSISMWLYEDNPKVECPR